MEIAGSHVSAHVVQSLGCVPSPEAFHAAVETLRRTRTPSNDDDPLRAKLRTLHAWLAKAVSEKNVAVPDDTVGVLELYLDAGEATAPIRTLYSIKKGSPLIIISPAYKNPL